MTPGDRDGVFARLGEHLRECELLVMRLRTDNAALRGRVAELEAANARLRAGDPVAVFRDAMRAATKWQ